MAEGSILEDVREACNLNRDDSSFDGQLIPLINTQLMMAHQFGVGYSGFTISDNTALWSGWLGSAESDLAAVKTWVGYQVLLLFDPPDNNSLLNSYKDQIEKFEWMLREKVEEKGYVKDYVPEKASFYEDK